MSSKTGGPTCSDNKDHIGRVDRYGNLAGADTDVVFVVVMRYAHVCFAAVDCQHS